MNLKQTAATALLLSALIAYNLLEELSPEELSSEEEKEQATPQRRPRRSSINQNPVAELDQMWGAVSKEALAKLLDKDVPEDADVSD